MGLSDFFVLKSKGEILLEKLIEKLKKVDPNDWKATDFLDSSGNFFNCTQYSTKLGSCNVDLRRSCSSYYPDYSLSLSGGKDMDIYFHGHNNSCDLDIYAVCRIHEKLKNLFERVAKTAKPSPQAIARAEQERERESKKERTFKKLKEFLEE